MYDCSTSCTPTQLTINGYLGQMSDFSIAEAIIYEGALNDNEIRQVEQWIADKYGLSFYPPLMDSLKAWFDGTSYDEANNQWKDRMGHGWDTVSASDGIQVENNYTWPSGDIIPFVYGETTHQLWWPSYMAANTK